jgi:hypothetical protein
MTDHIIKAAKEAGMTTGDNQKHNGVYWWRSLGRPTNVSTTDLERFYAIARAEALEDAAKVAEAQQDLAEQEKADKRFKAAMKDLEAGKATERNAVDRGDHWMCVATCNAVLRNAAKAIRSLKEQQHG